MQIREKTLRDRSGISKKVDHPKDKEKWEPPQWIGRGAPDNLTLQKQKGQGGSKQELWAERHRCASLSCVNLILSWTRATDFFYHDVRLCRFLEQEDPQNTKKVCCNIWALSVSHHGIIELRCPPSDPLGTKSRGNRNTLPIWRFFLPSTPGMRLTLKPRGTSLHRWKTLRPRAVTWPFQGH